jgi:TonB-linked SusC/RagA family outer membrane protein
MHLRLRGKAVTGLLPFTQHFPYKLFLLMRLTAFLVLAFSLQVTARTTAQQVTLQVKDAALREVFQQIKRQTGYSFVYTSQMLEKAERVDLTVKNVPLQQVLEKIFFAQPLQFSIVDKVVIVKFKPEDPAVMIAPPPAVIEVQGTVIDEKTGNPLTDAIVTIKGTKKAAFTDVQGKFKIQAAEGAVLVISFVGYENREVKATAGVLRIALPVSTQSMNEMVVTGVFNRPRANFTGASSSFSREDLRKVSNTNLLAALSVLDPAVQLPENINLGSNPNVLPDVVIRGGNSLPDLGTTRANQFNYQTTPNVPLFILDGFEVSLQRINDLDMNRIARVDILKDAGATTIYGSRAANGVIVIETVRPQDGKLRVTYNSNYVVETPDLSGYDLLNAAEKLEIERKTNVYVGNLNAAQERLNTIYNARLAEVKRGTNTYWLAKPLRAGFGHKQNIYLEGGGNAALYGLGVTYDQRTGVMKGSDRRNISANSFLSYRVQNFQFRNDLTLTYNRSNNSPYGAFTKYSRLNPYWNPYDSNGVMKVTLEDIRDPVTGARLTDFDSYDNLDGSSGRAVNPLYNASLNLVDRTTYQNLTNNFYTQWQAAQWLRITARFSYQQQSDESDIFLPAAHTSFINKPNEEKGSYTKGYGKRNSMEGMLTADVSKRINEHLFYATLGMNVQSTKFNTINYRVEGFPNPRLDELILGNRYALNSKPTGSEGSSRMAGYLTNLSYSYNNRYMVDVSYRLDGSSQFGTDQRFAPFFSAGAGWNIHNEKFFRQFRNIDRLKLRYSFGSTGSQNFPSYLGITTSQYNAAQDYRGIINTSILGYGNPGLAWQKTKKNNFGLDLTLLHRLDITANYFVEKTQGSIAVVTTAPSTGFGSYSENIGNLVSKGYELNARYNILVNSRTRDNWSVFVNLFSVSNKVERVSNTIAELNKRANSTSSPLPSTRYVEGQSTTTIWAVPSKGIDPSSGVEIFQTREGKLTTVYNPLDQVIVGDSRANVEGTFGTNLDIKGIGFSAAFRFRYGGQAYNQTLIQRVENVTVRLYNVDRRVAEQRWLKPGDKTFFKGLLTAIGETPGITNATSRFVQDDNSLLCQSMSVYYRFSDAFNKRLKLSNTRITLYTNDVFAFTSIKRERGLDYPFSHNFSLMLQTSF